MGELFARIEYEDAYITNITISKLDLRILKLHTDLLNSRHRFKQERMLYMQLQIISNFCVKNVVINQHSISPFTSNKINQFLYQHCLFTVFAPK